MEEPRANMNLLRVVKVLFEDLDGQHYALDLSKTARVNVGTIYAVVARLERHGIVKSALEDVDPQVVGRPPRRYYRLTAEGVRYAERTLREQLAPFGLPGGTHA